MSESEPRLIRGYLQVLASQLPASIVDELADGLTETYRFYLSRGLSAEEAAEAAVREFGSPEEILAAFARVNPARRAARRLLGLGPVVGGCWVAALVTSRVWPGPLPARVGVSLAFSPASVCWRWRRWSGGTGFPFSPGRRGSPGSRRWIPR